MERRFRGCQATIGWKCEVPTRWQRTVEVSTFTIARTVGAPTIREFVGPTEPQAIDVPVGSSTTFIDPSGVSDDYRLIIDWGDGSDPQTIPVAADSNPPA